MKSFAAAWPSERLGLTEKLKSAEQTYNAKLAEIQQEQDKIDAAFNQVWQQKQREILRERQN